MLGSWLVGGHYSTEGWSFLIGLTENFYLRYMYVHIHDFKAFLAKWILPGRRWSARAHQTAWKTLHVLNLALVLPVLFTIRQEPFWSRPFIIFNSLEVSLVIDI